MTLPESRPRHQLGKSSSSQLQSSHPTMLSASRVFKPSCSLISITHILESLYASSTLSVCCMTCMPFVQHNLPHPSHANKYKSVQHYFQGRNKVCLLHVLYNPRFPLPIHAFLLDTSFLSAISMPSSRVLMYMKSQ